MIGAASFVLVLCAAAGAGGDGKHAELERALSNRVVSLRTASLDYEQFFGPRQPPGPERFSDRAAWQQHASAQRQRLLDEIFMDPTIKQWAQAPVRIEQVGPPIVGAWHRVRRYRLEIVPGLWTSMFLHEPLLEPKGRVPVVLSFLGHVTGGDATDPVHQARAIHLSQQGLYVVTVDWFGNGELDEFANTHMALNHIDLWGAHGVGVMYLLMQRALDFALSLEHVDGARVAATGLSGGGWQTIVLAALDERVTLAAPIAGFAGYELATRVHADLPDSEQAAPGFYRMSDYPELAALVAPRPLLLGYNYPESCCFRSDRVIPLLQRTVQPIYELVGAADQLRFHVDDRSPGTHNYEATNRRALYQMLIDHGFVGEQPFSLEEDELALDTLSPEEMAVGFGDHVTLIGLATRLADQRVQRALPDAASFNAWRQTRIAELDALLGSYRVTSVVFTAAGSSTVGGLRVERRIAKLGTFSAPVVEITSATSVTGVTSGGGDDDPTGTVILLGDDGRAPLAADVAREARTRRVVLVDLLHFGDRRHRFAEPSYSMLIGSTGESSLGIQTAELAALAEGYARSGPVEIRALGHRASFIALVTAARSNHVSKLSALRLLGLETLTRRRAVSTVHQRPEAFVFGMGARFAMDELLAMTLPTQLDIRAAHEALDDEGRIRLEKLAAQLAAPKPLLGTTKRRKSPR